MELKKKILFILLIFLLTFVLFFNKSFAFTPISFDTPWDETYSLELSDTFDNFPFVYILSYYQSTLKEYNILVMASNEELFIKENKLVNSSGNSVSVFTLANFFTKNDVDTKLEYYKQEPFSSLSTSFSTSYCSGTCLYTKTDLKAFDGEVLFPATPVESEDDNINNSINDVLSGSSSDIDSITNSISNSDWISDIDETNKTSIANSPKSISNAFSSIFNIFNFIGNIKNAMLDVWNFINDSSNLRSQDLHTGYWYVLPLELTLSTKYFSGKYTVFDLNWYAPYKPYGDAIITAFCYISFILHVFRNLPNYVSGASSVTYSLKTAVDDGRE